MPSESNAPALISDSTRVCSTRSSRHFTEVVESVTVRCLRARDDRMHEAFADVATADRPNGMEPSPVSRSITAMKSDSTCSHRHADGQPEDRHSLR